MTANTEGNEKGESGSGFTITSLSQGLRSRLSLRVYDHVSLRVYDDVEARDGRHGRFEPKYRGRRDKAKAMRGKRLVVQVETRKGPLSETLGSPFNDSEKAPLTGKEGL